MEGKTGPDRGLDANRSVHVALARRLYEAQRHHDNETIFSIYDPSIEWDMSHYPRWLESSSYRGHAGVREFMSTWLGLWTDWESEVEEAIEVDDRVLLVVHDRARLRGSSGAIERRYGHLLTFRGGRIVRSALYHDLDDAHRDIAS